MTSWGWKNIAPNGDGDVHWIPGSLEASYERAARFGGQWILVSANPISEYRRVLDDARRAK